MTTVVHADARRPVWTMVGGVRRRVPADVAMFTAYQVVSMALIVGFALHHGVGLPGLSFRFRKWDASWLLSIAHHGYQPDGDRRSAIAFFPLYPGVVRAAMLVVRKDVIAALAVSAVASVIGHTVLYRALRSRPELTACASGALILLVLWPTTIFFSLAYTESLYLALTAGFLYFLLHDRVGAAAGLAALAALTRQPGVLCLVPLTLWILTDPHRPWARRVRRLGWVAVGATGYATFLLINRLVYGEWFAFVDELRSRWGKRTAPITQTISDAVAFLREPSWYFGWTNLADHYLVLAALVVFVAWPIVCWRRFERCRWVLLAWGVTQWVLIASSSAPKPGMGWISSTRYLMLVLPLFVAIADLVGRRRWLLVPLGAAGTVFGLMVVHRWITKQWTA